MVSFTSKRYVARAYLLVGCRKIRNSVNVYGECKQPQRCAAGPISDSTGCGLRLPAAPEPLGERWPHTGALRSKFSFEKFSFVTRLLTSDNCPSPLSLYFPLMGNGGVMAPSS